MKSKCCCCMKQKHGTWETCDRTRYWCGRKHVGVRCVNRSENFYKKHGGQRQIDILPESDIRSRQADYQAYDHAPAPQNQRSAGGDVTRWQDLVRRLNAPRDDVSSRLQGMTWFWATTIFWCESAQRLRTVSASSDGFSWSIRLCLPSRRVTSEFAPSSGYQQQATANL
ncbi:hypothetical protein BKA80DRAFT_303388 [Phyllosticta citrichinensis]